MRSSRYALATIYVVVSEAIDVHKIPRFSMFAYVEKK